MLDHVGAIDRGRIDAGFVQGSVEQLPGRAHERTASLVLHRPWLLSHHHELRTERPAARNALGRVPVELAALARLNSRAQRLRCGAIGHPPSRTGTFLTLGHPSPSSRTITHPSEVHAKAECHGAARTHAEAVARYATAAVTGP